MKSLLPIVFMFVATCIVGQPGLAAITDALVYIECTDEQGKTSKGSGVIVSADGLVITAGHVVPAESNPNCKASLQIQDTPTLRLNVQLANFPTNSATGKRIDVALLKFRRPRDDYPFVNACNLEGAAGKDIIAAGFPGESRTGEPSFRKGIISVEASDNRGFLETDALTVGGMSGGPVFPPNRIGIVGIIAGASFDGLGQVTSYDVLSIEQIRKGITKLELTGEDCFPVSQDITSQVVKDLEQVASLEARVRQLELGLAANLSWSSEVEQLFGSIDAIRFSYSSVFRNPHIQSVRLRSFVRIRACSPQISLSFFPCQIIVLPLRCSDVSNTSDRFWSEITSSPYRHIIEKDAQPHVEFRNKSILLTFGGELNRNLENWRSNKPNKDWAIQISEAHGCTERDHRSVSRNIGTKLTLLASEEFLGGGEFRSGYMRTVVGTGNVIWEFSLVSQVQLLEMLDGSKVDEQFLLNFELPAVSLHTYEG